ncbi:hypothetical protein A3Q56_03338, partial [Intoshia linei]
MRKENHIQMNKYHYVHILNKNTCVIRCISGMQNIYLNSEEKFLFDPKEMIMVNNNNFCIIKHPVKLDEKGNLIYSKHLETINDFDEIKIIYQRNYFPLYPGEKLLLAPRPYPTITTERKIRLRARCDLVDFLGVQRYTDDTWVLYKVYNSEGVLTEDGMYKPVENVEILSESILPEILTISDVLHLKAVSDFVGYEGIERKCGENWNVHRDSNYLYYVDDENCKLVKKFQTTLMEPTFALNLICVTKFYDKFGKVDRNVGDIWQITHEITPYHFISINERLIGRVIRRVIKEGEYVNVSNVFDTESNKNNPHQSKQLIGPCIYFVMPYEILSKTKVIYVLNHNESILLLAKIDVVDTDDKNRVAGEEWVVHGPTKYIPPIGIDVTQRRLDLEIIDTGAVYILDRETAMIRKISGTTYCLGPYEVIWQKPLSSLEYQLAIKNGNHTGGIGTYIMDNYRPARVYRVDQNHAMQLNNYSTNTSRVIFGPQFVIPEAFEIFTTFRMLLYENVVNQILLPLGPKNIITHILVTTSDHAILELAVKITWRFEVNPTDCNQEESEKIFSNLTFTFDITNSISSSIRSIVSRIPFEEFHKRSSEIILNGIFKEKEGKLFFPSNLLAITAIDILSVKPTDEKMSDQISKSVHLAIEILSKSREAEAKNKLLLEEQKSKGTIDIDMIKNEILNEHERISYTKLINENNVMSAINNVKVKAVALAKENELSSQQRLEGVKLQIVEKKIRNNFEQNEIEKSRTMELENMEFCSKQNIEQYERKQREIIETVEHFVDHFGHENIVKLFKMKDYVL